MNWNRESFSQAHYCWKLAIVPTACKGFILWRGEDKLGQTVCNPPPRVFQKFSLEEKSKTRKPPSAGSGRCPVTVKLAIFHQFPLLQTLLHSRSTFLGWEDPPSSLLTSSLQFRHMALMVPISAPTCVNPRLQGDDCFCCWWELSCSPFLIYLGIWRWKPW